LELLFALDGWSDIAVYLQGSGIQLKRLTDLVADGAAVVVASAVVATTGGNGDEDTVGALDLEERGG
jgi:hypothetical protein